MSTNEDVLRSFYTAFHQDDIEGAVAVLAADVTWIRPEHAESGGGRRTTSGHQRVRAMLTKARAEFGELRPEPREFIASGTRVVVLGDYRARGGPPAGATGGTVPFAHTWNLHHGRATRFEDVHDAAEIRRILGSGDGSSSALDGILRLGLGFWRSGTVLAAVRLGVFTALAGKGLDLGGKGLGLAELAARTGVHDRGARDFFDALVALGLLRREDGKYRNAPHAAEHLDAGKPETYVGGLLAEAGDQWYPAWTHLTEALAEGTPRWVVPSDADNPYEQIYAAPERLRHFQRAMIGGAMTAMLALPRKFPWHHYRTVTDVGCCGGEVLAHLLTRHPHLSGVGFDLPVVATAFAETSAAPALTGRMRFVAGDFRTDPLPVADVLVFGHVLHNWDLETKRMLLRKAHDALPEHGQVVIYEELIDDDRRQHVDGLMMSLHMLVMSPAGFGYTGAQCQDWLATAGFQDSRVEHLGGSEFMVIGTKGSSRGEPGGRTPVASSGRDRVLE